MADFIYQSDVNLHTSSRLYSWGWGVHGQLGHGDVEERLKPHHVISLASKNIMRVAAGYTHTLVLSSQVIHF